MSPKANEKCVFFLMTLVMVLTLLLAFMLHVVNQEVEPEVRTVYVEVPVEIHVVEPAPLTDEPEDAIEELTGPELYASYVDEITTEIYPDVDPMLVKAIIHHESRFIPDAVNPNSKTTGLTQISPRWHSARAERLGVTDLTDPYGNILVCCDILHELYQSYSTGYSLNIYAGGYDYANKYIGSTSPFEKEIAMVMQGLEDGTITIGGD